MKIFLHIFFYFDIYRENKGAVFIYTYNQKEKDKLREKGTVGGLETDRSLYCNCIRPVCLSAWQFFSLGSYVYWCVLYEIAQRKKPPGAETNRADAITILRPVSF